MQDDIERLYTKPYDISGLKNFHDDIILLEWDIAVSKPDLERFTERAKGDWPIVAPFLARDGSKYLHQRREANGYRPIIKNEPTCDVFGFGLVYFPAWVIRQCPQQYGSSSIISDGTLPYWLQEQEARPVPVDWSITIVHLG